jgi:hypothetical protein
VSVQKVHDFERMLLVELHAAPVASGCDHP